MLKLADYFVKTHSIRFSALVQAHYKWHDKATNSIGFNTEELLIGASLRKQDCIVHVCVKF